MQIDKSETGNNTIYNEKFRQLTRVWKLSWLKFVQGKLGSKFSEMTNNKLPECHNEKSWSFFTGLKAVNK